MEREAAAKAAAQDRAAMLVSEQQAWESKAAASKLLEELAVTRRQLNSMAGVDLQGESCRLGS